MKQSDAVSRAFIEPMKALPVHELPVGDWLYELKFDGYRALAWDLEHPSARQEKSTLLQTEIPL
ncbi:MAG: hypothetical protein JOZ29_07600 [Deltaproteobacteria bacterium]|nr:hypothetical protein [Deltaproteobacteria bacterium]